MLKLIAGPRDLSVVRSQSEEPTMKSKNPSKHRVAKRASRRVHRATASERAVVLDFVLFRIEAFIQKQGGGVSVRRDRGGYTLIRDDTGTPVARLRPQDRKGGFEILYSSPDTGRWRSVGRFGGSPLPLDEALDFIASDPMDCFWT
jgi:hypothetical protein